MSELDQQYMKALENYIPNSLPLELSSISHPFSDESMKNDHVFETDSLDSWTYVMRREMQEIIPGLFLGPYNSASKSKLNALVKSEITHIICIRKKNEAHIIKPNFPDKFIYLTIDLEDTMTENIIPAIVKCREFIDNCLQNGGKCLIHSYLGISRSPSIAIAYVMGKCSYSCRQAFNYVKSRRFCVNPNDHFSKQLLEYEAIYRAEKTALQGQCSRANGKLKRKHEIESDSSEPMEDCLS